MNDQARFGSRRSCASRTSERCGYRIPRSPRYGNQPRSQVLRWMLGSNTSGNTSPPPYPSLMVDADHSRPSAPSVLDRRHRLVVDGRADIKAVGMHSHDPLPCLCHLAKIRRGGIIDRDHSLTEPAPVRSFELERCPVVVGWLVIPLSERRYRRQERELRGEQLACSWHYNYQSEGRHPKNRT